jgi:UDP-GlcNAc:undecaprenyl-phosphate/decaprenyl-phosphate GlcNAc-1-phosphate transferase
MIWFCIILILLAFVLNLPLTWWFKGAGVRWGLVDKPSDLTQHKHHDKVTPVTGGIALFLSVCALVVAGLIAIWVVNAEQWQGWLSPIQIHIEGIRSQTWTALAILACAFILHVVGIVDDIRPMSPGVKLYVQFFVAGVCTVAFDMRVLQFMDAWGSAGLILSTIVSVLWIITIINAINFLDNMDGLSAGVSAIIASLYLAATVINGQWFVAALCAIVLGALLAFLIFNFPPAKVFMGDAGSLVVGFLLAIISIRTTYFDSNMVAPIGEQIAGSGSAAASSANPVTSASPASHWHGVLMPLIVMAIPLYDITSVTLIRLKQGKSPFIGDQQHFSHRLVQSGLSKRHAVLVVWCCTLATGIGGVMLTSLASWQALLVAGQTAAVLLMLALLERRSRRDQ